MDQVALNDLSEHEINAVFAIVKDATTVKQPKEPETPIEQKLDKLRIEIISYAYYGLAMMFVLTGALYYFRSSTLADTIVGMSISVILLLYLVCILFIPSSMFLILKLRKEPYSFFLNQVRTSCSFDLQYVNRLLQCDKRAVQYVLTYYKYERNDFKHRCGIISGSLENVGLFPALGALMVLAFTLSKVTFGLQFAKMLPVLIFAFYFLYLTAYTMLKKIDRVIALLEFSVQDRLIK